MHAWDTEAENQFTGASITIVTELYATYGMYHVLQVTLTYLFTS